MKTQTDPSEHVLRFSRFNDVHDNVPRPDWRTWPGFIAEFSKHTVRGKKDGPLVGFSVYKPGTTRGIDGILECTSLGLDVDPDRVGEDKLALATVDAVCAKLNGRAYLIYSSWGEHAKPGYPSLRIILPCDRAITPAQHYVEWERANALLGGILDLDCKDPSRIFYTPSCPPERASAAFVRVGEGAFWAPDETGAATPKKPEAPRPAASAEDLAEVIRKLAASPTVRYGPVFAELARRLRDRKTTTDGWGDLLCQTFIQALMEAGATDAQIESLHVHGKFGRKHTWASIVKRIRSGRKAPVKARASTLAEKEPAFAEVEKSLGPTGNARPTSPWAGKPGCESEPKTPILLKDEEVPDGKGGTKTIKVPKERAYVLYNRLVTERGYRPFRLGTGEARVAIPTERGLVTLDPADERFPDWIGYYESTRAGEPVPLAHARDSCPVARSV